MTSDGFKANGNLAIESKEKLFKVECDHKVGYTYTGGMDVKKYKDIFSRYLVACGKQLAKVWLEKEKEVIKAIQKLLDKAEAQFKKKAKKLNSLQEIKVMARETQDILQKAASKLTTEKLGTAINDTAADSHKAALKSLAKDARDVLVSKKDIAYKITLSVLKFALVVVVVTLAAIATVATGGAAAVLIIPVGALVIKSVLALINARKASKDIQKDLQGNYKAYKTSVEALNNQFQETIKLSRGLTANWDRLHLQQATAMTELNKILKNMPKGVSDNKKAKEVEALRKKIEDDGATIQKILDYKPADIEVALVKARGIIPSKDDVEKVSTRLKAAETWFGRMGQWASGAKGFFSLADN